MPTWSKTQVQKQNGQRWQGLITRVENQSKFRFLSHILPT